VDTCQGISLLKVKMNKKGFELATNMLVVIILSLVLLGAGIAIFAKIVSVSQDIKTDLDQQTIEQLDIAMDDGSLIVVPRNRVTTNRGEVARFTIGFWNEGDNGDFTLNVTANSDINWKIVYVENYNDLETNKRAHALIGIGVPKETPKGQYTFDITIYKGSNVYENKKRVSIVVP